MEEGSAPSSGMVGSVVHLNDIRVWVRRASMVALGFWMACAVCNCDVRLVETYCGRWLKLGAKFQQGSWAYPVFPSHTLNCPLSGSPMRSDVNTVSLWGPGGLGQSLDLQDC